MASLTGMLSVLIAVVGLALLIVIHEGGHFLVARLCGMRVERFSVGFGKPLISFKRGETIYQLAPIPLGGFVQITGLNPHEEFDQSDPYVYPNRPRWMRVAVLVAGPAANYLTAVLLAAGIFIGYGQPTNTSVVDGVVAGSPAEAAGLEGGDVLISANGKAVSVTAPISAVIREAKGQPITVKFLRGGREQALTVAPRQDPVTKDFLIGIRIGQLREKVGVGSALVEAFILPVPQSAAMLKGIWRMIVGREAANLSGPVGIAQEMANAAKRGFHDFLYLLMILSIYLGLFNLLPLPALDGGRVLFLGINALPIKEISAKREASVHMVGLLLLLGVFVLVTFKDILKLVI
jgi:regulator of sigma E protease